MKTYVNYNGMQVPIIIIPKDAILFKCIINKPNNNADIFGIEIDKDKYCLPRAHNVFFYPHPFIIDSNLYLNSAHRKIYIYKTNHKLKIISLLTPEFTEADAINAGVLVNCNLLSFCNNGFIGKKYDTCITNDFMKAFPNIIGCTRIVEADNNHYKTALAQKKYVLDKSIFFDKSHNFFPNGIPEIFMYPYKKQAMDDIFFYNTALRPKGLNYTLIKNISHQPYNSKDGFYAYIRKMIKTKKFIYTNGWFYYSH